MAYGDFEGLSRKTASEKYCVIKHLTLLKILNMMDTKENNAANFTIDQWNHA